MSGSAGRRGGIAERWGAELREIQRVAAGHRPSGDLLAVIDGVIRRVAEMLNVANAAAWLHDDEADAWYLATSIGFSQRSGIRFTGNSALPCLVGARGVALRIDDLDSVDFHRLSPDHERLRSAMYAPMRLGQQTVGVLAVYAEDLAAYDTEDLELLTAVGEHLGVAVAFSVMDERSRRIAVLEERDRQARELHDGVSQGLCALRALVLEAQRAFDCGEDDSGRDVLRGLEKVVDEVEAEVRDSIRTLRTELVPRSFATEVDRTRRRLESAGIRTTVDVVARSLTPSVSNELAWILREAVTNVLKHSDARCVTVALRASDDSLELVIEDDGCGMGGSSEPAAQELHLGITVMGERAQRLGGTVYVSRARKRGTRVECRLPMR